MLKDTKRKLTGDEVEELLTELGDSSAWSPCFYRTTCCRNLLQRLSGKIAWDPERKTTVGR